ncbi:hypothetical protein KSP40_PGU018628 [Platanthera guangdongensis]|uniref:Uncharacterized protein n=1 Tax=Platanthera guangdongensis TaxID=2320717 RepID=A0ABR2N564_9ASPA
MEESIVIEMRGTGINGDDQPQQSLFSATQHHPLTEISTSPGHLLLLKLWQRNEGLIASRVVTEESRLDAAKRGAFQICSAFFFFHGLFFTLLFTTSAEQSSERPACRGWWLPSFLSLFTCLVLIISVQASICSYWKIHGKLQRERGDGRALARCVQELRMKGASFDLSKEPQESLRMKSSSVGMKWRLIKLKWCSRNAVTILLLCFSAMVFPASKFILCS